MHISLYEEHACMYVCYILESIPTYKRIFVLAVGCERYSDGSSLLILNNRKHDKTIECVGEKIIVLNKTRCSFLSHETQYFHNESWDTLEMRIGSFELTMEQTRIKV